MIKEDKTRLERNDQAMLRWICGVKFSDRVSVDSLYQCLGIAPLTTLLRSRRLRWFGHVSRSDGWINQCRNFDARGKRGKGRPRKSWDDVIMDDLNSCSLNKESALDSDLEEHREKCYQNVQPLFQGKKTINRICMYVCMYV